MNRYVHMYIYIYTHTQVSGFCAACLVPFLSKLCLERVDAREERESQKSIENANMLEFGNKEGDMSGIKDGDKADQLGNGQDTEKVHICMHIYKYIFIHICIQYIYIYVHIYIHIYIY
jgi:hypothetical protein